MVTGLQDLGLQLSPMHTQMLFSTAGEGYCCPQWQVGTQPHSSVIAVVPLENPGCSWCTCLGRCNVQDSYTQQVAIAGLMCSHQVQHTQRNRLCRKQLQQVQHQEDHQHLQQTPFRRLKPLLQHHRVLRRQPSHSSSSRQRRAQPCRHQIRHLPHNSSSSCRCSQTKTSYNSSQHPAQAAVKQHLLRA